MTRSKAHIYRQHHNGRWSLGLGFHEFVTFLDDTGKFREADLHLMARGWSKVGDWERDPQARTETWRVVIEGYEG